MAGTEELIQIRMRLSGGQEVAGEAQVVSGELKAIGDETAAAGSAAASATPKVDKHGKTWSRVGRVAKLGALGAAGAVAGLGLVAKSGLTDLEDLSKTAYGLHRNLGLTVKDGSRWASVAKARNIDTKSLNMTFATLSRNFVAANQGGATQLKLFHSLGVSTKTLNQDQGNFNKLILDTAKGFGNTAGGAQRMHDAQSLLGRGYQSVLPIFADGTKSLKEQLGWADKYHTTVTGKQLPDIEKLISAQRQSTVAWEGIKMSLGAAVLPLVTRANTAFQNLAAKLTDPHLSTQEKLSLLGRKLAHAANAGFEAFTKMIPKIANTVGEHAGSIAVALVTGFLHANIWGQLAIGTFLITKMGGWGAIGSLGKKIGARIGIGVAEGEAAGTVGGGVAGGVAGGAAGGAGGSLFGKIAGSIGGSTAGTVAGSALIDAGGSVGAGLALAAGPAFVTGFDAYMISKHGLDIGASGKDLASTMTSTTTIGKVQAKKYHDLLQGMIGDHISLKAAALDSSTAQINDWIKTARAARTSGEITANAFLRIKVALMGPNQGLIDMANSLTGNATKAQQLANQLAKIPNNGVGSVNLPNVTPNTPGTNAGGGSNRGGRGGTGAPTGPPAGGHGNAGGGTPKTTHVHNIYLDGKKIAQAISEEAATAAARR